MTRPIATRTNHDHFGYYEIGPYKTYSKIEAIEISARTGVDLRWNFNNAVFQLFDWKTEPAGDLDFWYAERARQIREKYDYIVLMYSGGPDSWNMLKAFVDNNIFIDEIAHYIVQEGTPVSLQEEYNYEVFATSYPNAKQLIENNPVFKNTVHRVVDGGPHVIKKITSANPLDYFYQEGNFFFGTWGTTFSDIRYLVPDYQKLIDKKQTVCFVWGYDKPRVIAEPNGKFKIKFSECAGSMCVKPRDQIENLPDKFDEAFYWTPDLPELICKQAHILKRYVEKCTVTSVDNYNIKLSTKEIEEFGISFMINNQKYHVTKHGIHRLIYAGWDTTTIVCEKPSSPVLSNKDAWWFKDTNDKTTSWYVSGILHLRNHIKKINPKWWFDYRLDPNDPASLRSGIKQCEIFYDLN